MADKEMLIMDKNFLKALDASYFTGIEVEDIPYRELLQDSLYYPSSGHDGGAVKYMNMKYPELGINSFVYCDYAFGHEAFTREMNDFKGYQVVGSVSRQMDSVEEMMELCPDWKPVVPPGLSRMQYMSWASAWKPFIGWSVYERVEPFGPDHGPERFSLLYIGGEGVATYECLYWRFNVVPKVLCLVQDGGGFGLNYTSFDRPAGPMHWTLAHHPAHQMPQYVLTGGIMSTSLAWKGYRKVGHIDHYYYHNYGVAELFETELQKKLGC